MPDQPNARHLAEQLITASARAVLYGNLTAAVSKLDLPKEEFRALRREVADLIPKAVVTVTWPGTCGRKLATGECPDHDPESETDHG